MLFRSWVDFLGRWGWEYFATLTFRGDRIHPESAEKRFRALISAANRQVYGRKWRKSGRGLIWVCAVERQRRGVIHFHALLANLDPLVVWQLEAYWRSVAGFCRIERIRAGDAVRGYVSKYVAKGGELDLGGPGITRPKFESWPHPIVPWYRTPLGQHGLMRRLREALTPEEYGELMKCAARGWRGVLPEGLLARAQRAVE